MRVWVMDNDTHAIEDLKAKITHIVPDCEIVGFANPFSALRYGKGNGADVVFSDATLRQTQGASLVKTLRKAHPALHTVFVAAHAGFALSAIKLRIDGYLLKPASGEEIREELGCARTLHSHHEQKKHACNALAALRSIRRTEMPSPFRAANQRSYSPIKLTSTGPPPPARRSPPCAGPDHAYDRGIRSAVQTVISDMTRSLIRAEIFSVILRSRNAISIHADRVSCDDYDCPAGDPLAANAFNQNYLTRYSWAEDANGFLTARGCFTRQRTAEVCEAGR